MHLGKICATYWDYARLATCLLATTLVAVFPYHAETEWLADLHKIDSRLLLLRGPMAAKQHRFVPYWLLETT